ncbi:MAG: hypothetical protein AAF710_00285 [Planctomycetota bacterium]
MVDKDFTVAKVAWHTQQKGNQGREEIYRTLFGTYFKFLQEKGLVTRVILVPGAPVTDDMKLCWSDLTDRGKLLVKQYEGKWLAKWDRGNAAPDDVSILEKGLEKIDQQLAKGMHK